MKEKIILLDPKFKKSFFNQQQLDIIKKELIENLESIGENDAELT